MKTLLCILLLNVCCLAQASKETMTKIPCTPGVAGLDNEGTIGNVAVLNTHGGCPLKLEVKTPDVTLDGKHYDWCGPTHDGFTPCYRKAPPDGIVVSRCKDGETAHLELSGENTKFEGNTLAYNHHYAECNVRFAGTITVTIDGVKYDHCGPTKNGVTKCLVGKPGAEITEEK